MGSDTSITNLYHEWALSAIPDEIPDYSIDKLHLYPQAGCFTLYLQDTRTHARHALTHLDDVARWHEAVLQRTEEHDDSETAELIRTIRSTKDPGDKAWWTLNLKVHARRTLQHRQLAQDYGQCFLIFDSQMRTFPVGDIPVGYQHIKKETAGFDMPFTSEGFCVRDGIYMREPAFDAHRALLEALLESGHADRIWTPRQKDALHHGLTKRHDFISVFLHEVGERRVAEYCTEHGLESELYEFNPLLSDLLAQEIAWEIMQSHGMDEVIEFSKAKYAHRMFGAGEACLDNVFFTALQSRDPARMLRALREEYERAEQTGHEVYFSPLVEQWRDAKSI